jgi:hypothetical protein
MISIDDAKELAQTNNLRQVIIFGWDGSHTHITTYGESIVDSEQAAQGANVIKSQWNWPADTIVASEKVQKLNDRIKELESIVDTYYDNGRRW